VAFHLEAPYAPAGDQGHAIDELVRSIRGGKRYITLQGVTGVGMGSSISHPKPISWG